MAKSSYSQDFKHFNSNVKNYDKKIEIIDKNNYKKAEFMVLIANEEKKRRYGLMNLKTLPQRNGMLFLFEKPDIIHMWMKNTYISLDMIFIKNNEIVHIYKNARPLSLDIISSKIEVDKIIEINSGLVEKYNIKVEDKIIY